MPIRTQNNLPAKAILEHENIFVMDENRSIHQDIRPISIGILNLMPLKEATELQLLRSLSNTPLQVDISFLTIGAHESKNTSKSHLNNFYEPMEKSYDRVFDGLIITGAPVELMEFEQVDYWQEMVKVFEWSKDHVTSVLHLCWGAQAGLYYRYGIKKYELKDKVFGVFSHRVQNRKLPIVRGFDDVFYAPHSRHTENRTRDIESCKDLIVCAKSEEVGVFLCMEKDGSNIFVLGHPEYDRFTLDTEYKRDKNRGLPITLPKNYYPGDDENKEPLLQWRSHGNILYTNWLNYYVYQATPYEMQHIGKEKTGIGV